MAIGIILLVLIAAGVFLMFRMSRKDMESQADMPESGIPEGREEEYRSGMEPCECGIPVMYTLHTCRHCVHLKNFLDENGVVHELVYVDDFADPARKALMAALRKFNPRGSFPTLVLPDGRSVVGFREAQVRDLLHIEQ